MESQYQLIPHGTAKLYSRAAFRLEASLKQIEHPPLLYHGEWNPGLGREAEEL